MYNIYAWENWLFPWKSTNNDLFAYQTKIWWLFWSVPIDSMIFKLWPLLQIPGPNKYVFYFIPPLKKYEEVLKIYGTNQFLALTNWVSDNFNF